MFKVAHEINEELTKNKERYLLDFMNKVYNLFATLLGRKRIL